MSQSKPRPKPLSYQTQKCVLGYIEANTRRDLSNHCPSLRHLHVLLPLKIEYLKMPMTNFPLAPRPQGAMLNPNDTVFPETENFDELPGVEDFVPIYNFRGNYYVNNCEHMFEVKREESKPTSMFEEPKFTIFVAYSTRVDERDPERIWNFWPRTTTSAAMRHHLKRFLFREDVIHVDRFDVQGSHGNFEIGKGILKLRVKDLQYSNIWPQHETVFGALDPSSFPLRKLTVTVRGANDPVFQHEHLKSAKYLNIRCGNQQNQRVTRDLWAPTLVHLPMKTVVVSHWNIPKLHLAQLAQTWLQTSRDVSTKFTFPANDRFLDLNEMKNEIFTLTQIEGASRLLGQNPCYNYLMIGNKELNIYVMEGPDYEQASQRFFLKRSQHDLPETMADFIRFNEHGVHIPVQRDVHANFVREKYTLVMEVMELGTAL